MRLGAIRLDSKEELFDWADIATVHTGDRNYCNESNHGLVTIDDLRRMRGDERLGVFINYDRNDLGPDPAEIQMLLDEGALCGYATDVFPKHQEKDGVFQYPFDLDRNNIITTPHIAGSNPELLRKAAAHAIKRLLQWSESGDIQNDSLVYPRTVLPSQPYEGQVCVAIDRATSTGIFRDVLDVCGLRGKLSVVGTRQTEDYIPGTRVNRGTAHQFVYADQTDHLPYDRVVRSLVRGLADLNLHAEGSIRSIRVIPSTPEQKQILQQIKF